MLLDFSHRTITDIANIARYIGSTFSTHLVDVSIPHCVEGLLRHERLLGLRI